MVRFIADVGSNFNGSLELAKEYVKACKSIGVDIVKFQCWEVDDLFANFHPAYQTLKNCGKPIGLPLEWHRELIKVAREEGITFSTTPTQPYQIEKLEDIGIEIYKVASGDITFYPLLDEINKTGKKVILSTGASNLWEVEKALSRLINCKEVVILHCVSLYPTKPEEVNLNALKTLKKFFPENKIGISDHTIGIEIPLVSIPYGINYIEKHVTVRKDLGTPDSSFALSLEEFRSMVRKVRELEKALGNGEKEPTQREIPERFWARRGIYAKRRIKKGESINLEDISFLRPQKGIPAEFYEIIIGRKVKREIKEGEPITWELVN